MGFLNWCFFLRKGSLPNGRDYRLGERERVEPGPQRGFAMTMFLDLLKELNAAVHQETAILQAILNHFLIRE